MATTRSWLLLVVLLAGCESGNPEVAMDECFVKTTKEAIETCFPRPLHPETDPESPDYGRVPCVVIVSGWTGTPFCDCTRPGFTPASDAQVEVARSELEAGGLCLGACCENLCFCELAQLSGTELAYCQGVGDTEYEPGFEPQGFCYVEPDSGIGDPSTVEDCPDNQRQKVLYVPPYVLTNGSVAQLACLG